MLVFPEFALDPHDQSLVRGGVRQRLSAKDFALLYHLASCPGRTMSQEELLRAAWGNLAIGSDVLKVRIAKLRRLLGDDAREPRIIATIHGQGYRFLPLPETTVQPTNADTFESPAPLIERTVAAQALSQARDRVLRDQRRLVLVSGGLGVGKTTLLTHFLNRVRGAEPAAGRTDRPARSGRAVIGSGQCIRHYGVGEPFLPIMQAVSTLLQQDVDDMLAAALQRHAPSWLDHLLVARARRVPAEGEAERGPASERALRELTYALEAYAAPGSRVVILVVEDLQWADGSTLDLLRLLARRRDPARLLMLASFRDDEIADPLGEWLHDLRPQEAVVDVHVSAFSEGETASYLDRVFGPDGCPQELSVKIYERTQGNPLFMRDVIRSLQAHGDLVLTDGRLVFTGDPVHVGALVPASQREVFAQRRSRLAIREQHILEGAAVAGATFTAAAVAAAIEKESGSVEDECLRLARQQQFIERLGAEEWPDGTHTTRFQFVHALYQELWQAEISEARKQAWHGRVARRLEAGFGDCAPSLAVQLASHFEAAGEHEAAIRHHRAAARIALQRLAYKEAVLHLDRCCQLLTRTSVAHRALLEVPLQIERASITAITHGYGAPETAAMFREAHDLSARLNDAPEYLKAAFGLCRYFWVKGDGGTARTIAENMAAVASRLGDPVHALAASSALGSVLMVQGEFESTARVFEKGIALAAAHWRDEMSDSYASNLEVVCFSTHANALALSGRVGEARTGHDSALAAARRSSRPMSMIAALFGKAWFHHCLQEDAAATECARELTAIAARHRIGEFAVFVAALDAWQAALDGDLQTSVPRLEAAAAALQAAGAGLYERWVQTTLARALLRCGRTEDALTTMRKASHLIDRDGPGLYDAELHRVFGEAVATASGDASAAHARREFEKAIATARRQGATLWELRALSSVATLCRGRGDRHELRTRMVDLLGRFSDADRCPDVVAARRALDELPQKSGVQARR